MSDEADLPKALVKRLVKERLAARDAAAGDGEAAKSLQLNKVDVVRLTRLYHRAVPYTPEGWGSPSCAVMHPAIAQGCTHVAAGAAHHPDIDETIADVEQQVQA
jgi:hypothetical protein